MEFLRQLKEGKTMDSLMAAELEEQLLKGTSDESQRIKLIAYYSKNDKSNPNIVNHLIWAVTNFPATEMWLQPELHISDNLHSEQVLNEICQAWLRQVELFPNDATVNSNAAHYLLFINDEVAEKLLLKAQALEPDNVIHQATLSNLHYRRFKFSEKENKELFARKVLSECRVVMQLQNEDSENLRQVPRRLILETAIEVADFLGELGDATRFKKELYELIHQKSTRP